MQIWFFKSWPSAWRPWPQAVIHELSLAPVRLEPKKCPAAVTFTDSWYEDNELFHFELGHVLSRSKRPENTIMTEIEIKIEQNGNSVFDLISIQNA